MPRNHVCIGCESCPIRESCHRINGATRFLEKYAKWGGTAMFFVGSFLFATTHWAGNTPFVFLLFAIGHAFWTLAGNLIGDRSILLLNLMYLVFDLAAMYIRL